MANYTVRVELIDVDTVDYETLHEEMEKKGFSKKITSDSKKIEYYLPDAEYNINSKLDRDSILEKAKIAASKTVDKFRILVTQSKGRTWHNLKKV